MLHKTINLTEDGKVNMKTYIHDISDSGKGQITARPAIIVLPGGAYGYLEDREGEPAALTFMKEGFNTFVLRYSVGEDSVWPHPLEEVSKAIWEVRKNAEEWGINPNAICVMGFSAGACISAIAGTQWNTSGLAERLKIPNGGNKPNAVIMGYGAASNTELLSTPGVHVPPYLGRVSRDLTPELDIINYISEETAPMFIWHTRYDKYVPSVQPLKLAQKMFEFGLQYELHLFQGGRHGMSVSNNLSSYKDEDRVKSPSIDMWVQLCVNWLYALFNI